MKNHYSERDIMELDDLGNHYSNHVQAMTAENLRSKMDIAAELGWRDAEIERLREEISAQKVISDSYMVERNRYKELAEDRLETLADVEKERDQLRARVIELDEYVPNVD